MSTEIPKTMRGILVEELGGPEVLLYKTDLEVPKPGEGQVLVKNEYAGLNYIDTYFRTGLYPSKKPEILGRDGYGTIVSLGEPSTSKPLHDLQVGDKVVWLATGGYAEYVAAPALHTYKVPEGLDPKIALAAVLQGLTAITLIREAHPVQKGEFVLVHAAAGGVGIFLTQLLKAVGAHVIATASTAEKLETAKKNGAEYLINYSEEKDVVGKVLEITGGEGVAVSFDGVGKSTFDDNLLLVKRKGTIVSYGNASGAVPPFAIARLSAKNHKLLRPTLFNYISTRSEFSDNLSELFKTILDGKLDVKIHEVYPLEEVRKAHEDLEGRKTSGKLLLKI